MKTFMYEIFVSQYDVSAVNKFYFTFPYFKTQSKKMEFELAKLLHKYFISVAFDII